LCTVVPDEEARRTPPRRRWLDGELHRIGYEIATPTTILVEQPYHLIKTFGLSINFILCIQVYWTMWAGPLKGEIILQRWMKTLSRTQRMSSVSSYIPRDMHFKVSVRIIG